MLEKLPESVGSTITLSNDEQSNEQNITIKVYSRRYYMVILFVFLSFLNGAIFPQYVSLSSVNMCYYDVSMDTLNWTYYMMMISYIILIYPVSYFMNFVGLRWTVIAGSLTNTICCAVQFIGLKPDGFSVILFSSVFSSASNLLVLAVSPFLAGTWFPSTELSRACAAGVFGNQLGMAAGYLFFPLITPNNCSDKASIEDGKFKTASILTGVNLFWLILVVLTFQNSPKLPPSLAQTQKASTKSYVKSFFTMWKNINFLMLFVVYGFMAGSFLALTTVLGDLVLIYFPHKEKEIGLMGGLFIVSGLVGSMIAGTILDYTHRFKETTLGICLASLITFIIFCYLLAMQKLWVTFLTLIITGFFLVSFLPVGLEYGIELAFPESEVISASILNTSTALFGLIITEVTSYLLEEMGPTYSNVALALFIFTSCILTNFLTKKYKRKKKCSEDLSCNETDKENRL